MSYLSRLDVELRREQMGADLDVAEALYDAPVWVEAPAPAQSEGEFMDSLLAQLQAGEIEPLVRLSDEEWAAVEDEQIGDDFSRNPFLY